MFIYIYFYSTCAIFQLSPTSWPHAHAQHSSKFLLILYLIEAISNKCTHFHIVRSPKAFLNLSHLVLVLWITSSSISSSWWMIGLVLRKWSLKYFLPINVNYKYPCFFPQICWTYIILCSHPTILNLLDSELFSTFLFWRPQTRCTRRLHSKHA